MVNCSKQVNYIIYNFPTTCHDRDLRFEHNKVFLALKELPLKVLQGDAHTKCILMYIIKLRVCFDILLKIFMTYTTQLVIRGIVPTPVLQYYSIRHACFILEYLLVQISGQEQNIILPKISVVFCETE